MVFYVGWVVRCFVLVGKEWVGGYILNVKLIIVKELGFKNNMLVLLLGNW